MENQPLSPGKQDIVLVPFIERDLSCGDSMGKPKLMDIHSITNLALYNEDPQILKYVTRKGSRQEIDVYFGHDGKLSCKIELNSAVSKELDEKFAIATSPQQEIRIFNAKYIWTNIGSCRILHLLQYDYAAVAEVTLGIKEVYKAYPKLSKFDVKTMTMAPIEVTNDFIAYQDAIAKFENDFQQIGDEDDDLKDIETTYNTDVNAVAQQIMGTDVMDCDDEDETVSEVDDQDSSEIHTRKEADKGRLKEDSKSKEEMEVDVTPTASVERKEDPRVMMIHEILGTNPDPSIFSYFTTLSMAELTSQYVVFKAAARSPRNMQQQSPRGMPSPNVQSPLLPLRRDPLVDLTRSSDNNHNRKNMRNKNYVNSSPASSTSRQSTPMRIPKYTKKPTPRYGKNTPRFRSKLIPAPSPSSNDKLVDDMCYNRSVDISKLHNMGSTTTVKEDRLRFYDFAHEKAPSKEVADSEEYKREFIPMTELGTKLFDVHHERTMRFDDPDGDSYVTFTVMPLKPHIVINTDKKNQEFIKLLKHWPNLNDRDFGPGGSAGWESGSIRQTSQVMRQARAQSSRYSSRYPMMQVQNVHRCISSELNRDDKIIIMKNFEVTRYKHRRATAGMVLLSDQIGLPKQERLDTAVSSLIYPNASQNKTWLVGPHKIASCWKEKGSMILVLTFNKEETMEFIWWKDKWDKTMKNTIMKVKTPGEGFMIIIGGPGVDQIGWQKPRVMGRFIRQYYAYSFISKSTSYDIQLEMAAERAGVDVVKNVDKENKRFRLKNNHLIPYNNADYGAPRDNLLKNDIMQQDYHEVKPPDYQKLDYGISNDKNNKARGPIARSMSLWGRYPLNMSVQGSDQMLYMNVILYRIISIDSDHRRNILNNSFIQYDVDTIHYDIVKWYWYQWLVLFVLMLLISIIYCDQNVRRCWICYVIQNVLVYFIYSFSVEYQRQMPIGIDMVMDFYFIFIETLQICFTTVSPNGIVYFYILKSNWIIRYFVKYESTLICQAIANNWSHLTIFVLQLHAVRQPNMTLIMYCLHAVRQSNMTLSMYFFHYVIFNARQLIMSLRGCDLFPSKCDCYFYFFELHKSLCTTRFKLERSVDIKLPHIIYVKIEERYLTVQCDLNQICGSDLCGDYYTIIGVPRKDVPLGNYLRSNRVVEIAPKLRGGNMIYGLAFKQLYVDNNKQLLKLVHQHAKTLNGRFPGIVLPKRHSSAQWPIVFYKKENDRFHIQTYIRQLARENKIWVRFRKKHSVTAPPIEPDKINQYMVTSAFHRVAECRQFIQTENLCRNDPKLLCKDSKTQLCMRWEPINDTLAVQRVRNQFPRLKIHPSNYNEYLAGQKEDALYEVSQVFKYVMERRMCHMTDAMRRKCQYHLNKVLPSGVKPVEDHLISQLIHKYPFTQVYDPEISPLYSSIIDVEDDLKMLFINIDGGTRRVINDYHPLMVHLIRKHKAHIMAFVDTRGTTPKPIAGYRMLIQKRGDPSNNHIGGIIIYIKQNLFTAVKVHRVCPLTNIVWIQYGHKFIAVGYNRPYKRENLDRINQFYRSLNQCIYDLRKQNGGNTEIFIIGDLNARLGIMTGDKVTGSNINRQKLLKLLQEHDLEIANTTYTYGEKTFSYASGTGSSIIDYVLCADPSVQLEDMVVDDNAIFKAHRPIMIKIKDSPAQITEITKVFSIRNQPLDEESKSFFEQKLTKRCKQLNLLQKHMNEDVYTRAQQADVNDVLYIFAMYMFQYELIHVRGVKATAGSSRWKKISGEMVSILTKAEVLMKQGDPNNELPLIEEEYAEERRQEQKRQIQFYTDLFKQSNIPDKSKLVSRLLYNHGLQPEVPTLTMNNEVMSTVDANALHLSQVMKKQPKGPDMVEEEINMCVKDIMEDSTKLNISVIDIITAIKHTNSTGAPGYDYITQPMLRTGVGTVAKFWHIIMQNWNDTGIIPMRAKLGCINCISKKKTGEIPIHPMDYRPITLLPIIYKVYERFVRTQLNYFGVESQIHTLQGGFRTGRGVLEQLGTLRMISEYSVENHKPLYCVLLDIQKAYDTVWRKAILYKLRKHFGVPKFMCKLIAGMLCNTKSGMRNNSYITNLFPTTAGVVQGSVISPLLYGVFINDLIQNLNESELGVIVYKDIVPGLLYCDDIIIMAETKEDLQTLLRICEEHSLKWKYKFKPGKCHSLGHCMNKCDPGTIAAALSDTNKCEIQESFQKNIPLLRQQCPIADLQVAPIMGSKLMDGSILYGENIHGEPDIWDTGWFNSPMRLQVHKHFEKNDTAFVFQWEAIQNVINNDEGWMRWNLRLYGDQVQFSNQARYLGVQLYEGSKECIISSELTSMRFQQRMINKIDKITKQVLLRYDEVDPMDKVRLLKTFIMPLTEVFAQVLPMKYLNSIDESIMNSYVLAYGIHPKKVDVDQFAIWAGIPPPPLIDGN